MSSTTRPKPRPRPRARAPAATATTTDVPPSSSPGPSSTPTITLHTTSTLSTIEDEDELFMRNRTRTAQDWKQVSRMAAERETKKRKSSESNSDDEVGSSRSRNKKRPTKKKTDALPDWTKRKPSEIEISSDSDDEAIAKGKAKTYVLDSDDESPRTRARGKRPRSRSITPPPALPQYAIQRAREAVQQVVGRIPRAPSPTDVADDSIDSIALDPELASIARKVHQAAVRGTTPAVESGGPEVVRLKVAWKPHPLDPHGRTDSWGIEQKRHDSFHPLFGEVADLAAIPTDNLVVCYEGKRVFPSSNPHSIGIWAEAELEACDKTTYLYLQENKRIRSPSVAPGPTALRLSPSRGRSPSVAEVTDSDAGDAGAGSGPDEEEQSQTFHLTVRSERTKDKDISLLVRPTTKCGAIVRAFLKKAGLEAEYPVDAPPTKRRGRGKAEPVKIPALSVDGDKMDPNAEIGEADLEDGDQVEVVGL